MPAGLQAERTSLAWSRTLIGLVAVMALWLRTTAHPHPTVLITAAGYAVVAGFVALRKSIRYRRAESGLTPASTASVLDVLVLAGATVVLALQGLWWVAHTLR